MGRRRHLLLSLALLLWGALSLFIHAQTPAANDAGIIRVPVVFSGGHDTDPRDRGRPVILIAAALGVSSDVFREAFSHVHPAGPGMEPDPDQVRRNKAALMEALGPYGITDDQINTVSNYYRYNRSRGEMWKTQPATANARVAKGVVTGFEITSGGAGYSSPPTVTVPSMPGVIGIARLSFGKVLEENGAVTAIDLPSTQASPAR